MGAAVILFGFFVLGFLAYETYTDEPPVPQRVTDSSGTVLFSGSDIMAGQQIFLRNGLMEYGSIFGHGAYLGPDFTADYLHRAALSSIDYYGGNNSDRAKLQTVTDFTTNHYDGASGTLVFTAAQAHAFTELQSYYAEYFGGAKTTCGLRPKACPEWRIHCGLFPNRTEAEQLYRPFRSFALGALSFNELKPLENIFQGR